MTSFSWTARTNFNERTTKLKTLQPLTHKKIFASYGLRFAVLFLLAFFGTVFFATQVPNVTVSYLFRKNIILNLLANPFYNYYKQEGILGFLIVLILFVLGIIVPVICSIKKKIFSPYKLIYTSFLTLYFFVSFSFFVFTGDFLERAKKD